MEDALLKLVSAVLFGVPCDIPLTDEIRQEAKKQTVSSLLEADWRVLSRNMQVLHEHLALHELLTGAGIPYVILKGYASSLYYPEPDRRPLGDVDFLVDPADLERTDRLLRSKGYAPDPEVNDQHSKYTHNGVPVEMHRTLNGLPQNAAGDAARRYLADAIRNAAETPVHEGALMLPSPFHHGLITLLHIAKHMTFTGTGLRHLCDWAVFVNSVEDFPAMFRQAFEEIGVWEFAKQLTAVCCRYIGLPPQPWTGVYPEARLEALIQDILGSGNFGNKKDTKYQFVMLDSLNRDGTLNGGSTFRAMTRNISSIAKENWTACAKHPVLLPAGWIYVYTRYAWRVLTRKRKLVTRNTFREADRRRELYTGFRLYEKQ